MKFFIDTADLEEIAEAKSWGCLAGVTTNPSLYAKTGGKLEDFEPHMLKIAELCEGLPVSAEATANTAEAWSSRAAAFLRSHRTSWSSSPFAKRAWLHAVPLRTRACA